MDHLVAGVLAGGGSRRYGRDKAFVRWKGRPLVEHALLSVSRIADESYILSKEPEKFAHLPWTVIPDITATPTPMSGIITVSSFVCEWLLVAACDILVLDPSFLRAMWEAREPGKAVIPRTERGLQPLLAIYPAELLGQWERAFARGNFKLRPVAASLPRVEVDPAAYSRSRVEVRGYRGAVGGEKNAAGKEKAAGAEITAGEETTAGNCIDVGRAEEERGPDGSRAFLNINRPEDLVQLDRI
jgi:molybdopterin-guanine dinucleotide biosynthesis protein A